jgi:hypothetical protein
VDRGDGDDHVGDLFKGEVVADFAGVLRGGEAAWADLAVW